MEEVTSVPQRMHDQHRLSAQTGICEEDGWCNLKNRGQVLEHEDLRSNFELVLAQHGIEWPRPSTEANLAMKAPNEDPVVDRKPFIPAPPRGPVAVPDVFAAPSALPPLLSESAPSRTGSSRVVVASNFTSQGVKSQPIVQRRVAPVRSFVSRLLGAPAEERPFRAGADGEEQVEHQLSRLPDGWHLLHSLPVGSRTSDIDHVVVGPGGVFTVSAKRHPGATVWVDGDTFLVNETKHPYVRDARHVAVHATRSLTELAGFAVPAIAVIAVVGAHQGFTVKSQPADGAVHVVPRRNLVNWLLDHHPILSSDQVSIVSERARRSSTWS
jgi:hypothetical protein